MIADYSSHVKYLKSPWIHSPLSSNSFFYGEYDGAFACRQFITSTNDTTVAPYDFSFLSEEEHQNIILQSGGNEIQLSSFQQEWEVHAQGRLLRLAAKTQESRNNVYYIEMLLAPQASWNGNETSKAYLEIAEGIVRRQFEVFSKDTLVAPYDQEFPVFSEGIEQLEQLFTDVGLSNEENTGITSDAYHIKAISHLDFEIVWAKYANQRLNAIARNQR